ncbi:adenosylcobinamide amidohydrolase [Methanoregula sp.]|jgi:adenosylcobinamide hydrolase|uniref:adenosylcobinamide amidohydrolase n=1 Tax=Methanoregula sp. TaxID=2052170 RepID=UPI003C150516
MRYYLNTNTLFIRGTFRAASTGIAGGIRSVATLFNHTVPPGWDDADPGKEIELVAAGAGIGSELFGLLTAIPVNQTCVLQYDCITVFITAGIRREPPSGAGTINIIVHSREGMEDAALLELIMVATEAKTEALLALDLPLTGTPADAVITACEGETRHRYAGRLTEPGLRVREAVLHGIPEALRRHDAGVSSGRPAFFVYSRLQGGHWIEWSPHECPYYPCHFKGQSCDFCYCPFYPCQTESLGQWVESSHGGRVWNCAGCTLLHAPAVATYLRKYPGASRWELMKFAAAHKGEIP